MVNGNLTAILSTLTNPNASLYVGNWNVGPGPGIASVQINGSYTGQLHMAQSLDGANFTQIPDADISPVNGSVPGIPANTGGQYKAPCLGGAYVIVYAGTLSAGTPAVYLSVGPAPSGDITVNGQQIATTNPLFTVTEDPTSHLAQTVTSLHNSDNNAVPTGGSALSAGAAQLVNLAGNLDNQREIGIDNAPALGITTGAANSKLVGVTTLNGALASTGLNSFVVSAAGSAAVGVNGVPWTAKVGGIVTLDPYTSSAESFRINSVAGTTIGISGTTAFTHLNGAIVTFDTYNTSRDVSGENDGARGIGFTPAVDYLFNGGAGNGVLNYDRERSLQGELPNYVYLSSAASAGATSIVLSSVAGLVAGTGIDIFDPVGGHEHVVVRTDWNGSTTVPLTSALLYSHTVGGTAVSSGACNKASTFNTANALTGLANGDAIIIEPGTPNEEYAVVSSFVANTSVTLTAATVRNHASGFTFIWGACEYDTFGVFGPQNGPTGVNAEELVMVSMWDHPSKSGRLLQTASNDALNPAAALAAAPMVYNPSTDTVARTSTQNPLPMSIQALPTGGTYEKATSNGSPITTATTVAMFAAAGAGLYHHAWVQLSNGGATATEVQILDGATVVWDGWLPAGNAGPSMPPIPLVGLSANTALNIKVLTAGAAIYWSAYGWTSAFQY